MSSATVTIEGFVAQDSVLKFTPSGDAVCEFSIPHTPQRRTPSGEWEDTGPTAWYRCAAWGRPAEMYAELLVKGMRVKVTGPLTVREYETRDGEKRTSLDVRADQVGIARPRDGWPQAPRPTSRDPWGAGGVSQAAASMPDDGEPAL